MNADLSVANDPFSTDFERAHGKTQRVLRNEFVEFAPRKPAQVTPEEVLRRITETQAEVRRWAEKMRG